MNETWTGGQYSVYRALLGAFLVVHFAMLLPYGAEVFGTNGLLASAALSPYFGVLPNPLAYFDSPSAIAAVLGIGVVCGVAVAVGWFDRIGAIVAALILGWLFQRNPLIANPSLPLLGFLLVLHAFAPARPYGSVAALRGGADPRWRLPRHLHVAAWTVLALAYTHSGITKLFSASWMSGEAIRLVLENPLARDHVLRELMLALAPVCLQLLTWTILWVEVLFAPLVLFRRIRPVMWSLMLLAQLGFLTFLNFADLTFPMLLAHLITFDPKWLERWARKSKGVLLFDGECAFCHATVRLAMREDSREHLKFAPLASDVGARLLGSTPQEGRGDTIVLVDGRGYAVKSRAVAGVLEHLGGLWLLLGKLLRAIPRPIADAAYDFVGRMRYRLGGAAKACAILPAERIAR